MLNAQIEHAIKSYFADGINRLTTAVIVLSCIMTVGFYKTHTAIIKCEKKTDFRYFNTTRSLEDIYSVRINTKDGTILRRIEPNQSKP